jgi:hypothetical protein
MGVSVVRWEWDIPLIDDDEKLGFGLESLKQANCMLRTSLADWVDLHLVNMSINGDMDIARSISDISLNMCMYMYHNLSYHQILSPMIDMYWLALWECISSWCDLSKYVEGQARYEMMCDMRITNSVWYNFYRWYFAHKHYAVYPS